MTDYERVLDVFYSTIRNKHELPEGLLRQWFRMACNDFELDIAPLEYNNETQMFVKSSGAITNTLGLMMAKYFVKREQSRINRLTSIVGRDLRLTSVGDSKRALQVEYESILLEIEQKLYKQKTHTFN